MSLSRLRIILASLVALTALVACNDVGPAASLVTTAPIGDWSQPQSTHMEVTHLLRIRVNPDGTATEFFSNRPTVAIPMRYVQRGNVLHVTGSVYADDYRFSTNGTRLELTPVAVDDTGATLLGETSSYSKAI